MDARTYTKLAVTAGAEVAVSIPVRAGMLLRFCNYKANSENMNPESFQGKKINEKPS